MSELAEFDPFLRDDFERADLFELEPVPTSQDDPRNAEINDLSAQIATLRAHMKPKWVQIVTLVFEGKSKVEIIERLKTSYPTILKALTDDKGRKLLSLYQALSTLRRGPSQEARDAMLWRIALREEKTNPKVSINAVDVLNRAEGVYAKHDRLNAHPAKIVVQNYNFGALPPAHEDRLTAPTPKRDLPDGVIENEDGSLSIEVEIDDNNNP